MSKQNRAHKKVVSRPEFPLAGYDSLHWFEGEERLASQPVLGSSYRLMPDRSFPVVEVGEEFWSVFCPPFTHFNGWEERPEEIEESSFVLTEVTELQTDGFGVVVKRIHALKSPIELEPCRPTLSKKEISLLHYGRCSFTRWKNWTLIDRNMESDVGEWFLLHQSAGRTHLVLFGEWDFQRDWVYMGYSEVDPEEFGLSADG